MKVIKTYQGQYAVVTSYQELMGFTVDGKLKTQFRTLEEILEAGKPEKISLITLEGEYIPGLAYEVTSYLALTKHIKNYLFSK